MSIVSLNICTWCSPISSRPALTRWSVRWYICVPASTGVRGVRSSWLRTARNSLLALLARSAVSRARSALMRDWMACSFASRSICSARLRSVMSSTTVPTALTVGRAPAGPGSTTGK